MQEDRVGEGKRDGGREREGVKEKEKKKNGLPSAGLHLMSARLCPADARSREFCPSLACDGWRGSEVGKLPPAAFQAVHQQETEIKEAVRT